MLTTWRRRESEKIALLRMETWTAEEVRRGLLSLDT